MQQSYTPRTTKPIKQPKETPEEITNAAGQEVTKPAMRNEAAATPHLNLDDDDSADADADKEGQCCQCNVVINRYTMGKYDSKNILDPKHICNFCLRRPEDVSSSLIQ